MDQYLYRICHGATSYSRVIAHVAGPPGLNIDILYNTFSDLYDHGEADEWLEFYLRLGAAAWDAQPDVLLAAALHVIERWRASQLWYDGSGDFDQFFLNWLLIEYACTVVRTPYYVLM